MLLALGCTATFLVVLLFGRSVWSLLSRWRGWREARRLPRTVLDLKAERDSLKAEKAMMAAKLNTGLADMKSRLAEQMAEVSRNRNRLLDANNRLQRQSDEIISLKGEISRREEKIAALHDQIAENVKAIAKAWETTSEQEGETARANRLYKEAVIAVDIREQRIRKLESDNIALRESLRAFLPGHEMAEATETAVKGDSRLPEGNPLLAADTETEKPVSTEPVNVFRARFNVGNPIASPSALGAYKAPDRPMSNHVNDEPLAFPRVGLEPAAGKPEQTPLEQEMSNVLSLAERVRGLQKGVKGQR